MITNRRRFIFFGILSLLWMAFIFYKSSQPYHVQDIKPLLRSLLSEQTVLMILPHIEFSYNGGLVSYLHPYSMLEFFIRKLAHVTEYFILCTLLLQTLFATAVSRLVATVVAVQLSVLYAFSDEWHQTMVPNRTGHKIDVVVDSIGTVLAALLIPALDHLLRKKWNTYRKSSPE